MDMTNETKNASEKTSVAVVTGGSRGLGKSTVLALAERGVNSIFTFASKSKEADEVVLAVAKAGAKAAAFQLDTGKVPIIFVTTHGDEETRIRAIGARAVAFLAKPFERTVLLGHVRACLESR
jgi:NAD(P)-dependent dehydrogenase (short-subunit alcohol dehydrogenase family)